MSIVDYDPLFPDVSSGNEPDLSVIKSPIFKSNTDPKIFLEPSKIPMIPNPDLEALFNIPDLSIEFKLVEDQNIKLISLKDIDNDISKSGTIDSGRAEIMAESFTELFSVVPKNGFTHIPTKVGYKETQVYVKSIVAKEEAQLMDLFKTYIEGPLTDTFSMITSIKENYLPGLIRISESLRSELQVNHEKILGNPNSTIPLKDGVFIDLNKINLLRFDTSLINTHLNSISEFTDALKAIKEVFNCHHAKLFFDIIVGLDDDSEVSMVDLMTFVMSPNISSKLNEFYQDLIARLKIVTDLAVEAKAISDKPDLISKLVVERAEIFISLHHCLMKYSGLVHHLTILNLAIKQLLLTYLEL